MTERPGAPEPPERTSRLTRLVNFDAVPMFARGPSALTLATTIASQVLLVISGIIVARALGVEGRGTLALLWILPLSIVMIGGLGIPDATTYYVASEKSNPAAVVGMSVRIIVPIGVVLVLGYGTGLFLIGDVGGTFSQVDALLSICHIVAILGLNLGTAVLLGLKRYRSFNFGRLLAPLFYTAGTAILLLVGHATLTAILAASLGSFGLGGLAVWALVLRRIRPSGEAPDTHSRRIVSFGLRSVIGSTSAISDLRADQLLVGALMDARALGIYTVAIAFVNVPRFVADSIGLVAFPRIASTDSEEGRWKAATRAGRIGVPAIAAIVVPLLLALPVLVPLLFGDDFSDAIGVGRILLAGAFFLSVNRLLSDLASGLGHPGYGSITEVVTVLVFILGVLVFATPATENGIAVAVLCGGVTGTALLSAFLIRLRRLSPDDEGAGG